MHDESTRQTIARAAGRAGGLRNVARHGPDAVSRAARDGWWLRFEREVDPEGRLNPTERARRARYAMKAHMAELNLRSIQARKKKE